MTSQLVAIYEENSRRRVNEAIVSVLLSALSNNSQVLLQLATVFAALITALSIRIAPEVASFMLERIILKLKDIESQDSDRQATGGEEDVGGGKAHSNLTALLSHLFTFGVISDALLFDLANRIIEENVHLSSLLLMVQEVGPKLESRRLKELVAKMNTTKGEKSGNGSSGYRSFVQAQINDIQNDKKKNSAVLERTNRMRKWIRLLQKEGRVISPFEIGWKDLEDAETKGTSIPFVP